MCIIFPIDHIPCTHTVAIWQHCINATKAKTRGLSPCQRIRSHSRPILTRKMCIHCGGPRVFAIRRDRGVEDRASECMEELEDEAHEDKSEGNKSVGYDSGAIVEEEEDDDADMEISPRGSTVRALISGRPREPNGEELNLRLRRDQATLRNQRSPSGSRRPSWKPNLKKELTIQTFSSYDKEPDDTEPAENRQPPLPSLDTDPHPSPRKTSTLLHPSSPQSAPEPPSSSSPPENTTTPSTRRNALMHHHHPSAPTVAPEDTDPTTILPSDTHEAPLQSPRKWSTLLHPSPPEEESSESSFEATTAQAFPFALPTPPSSANSFDPNTPARAFNIPPTPSSNLSPRRKKSSIIHSSHSDPGDRYDSNPESPDSDSDKSELDEASDHFHNEGLREKRGSKTSTVIVATRVRMVRASCIEFNGADWRTISPQSQ